MRSTRFKNTPNDLFNVLLSLTLTILTSIHLNTTTTNNKSIAKYIFIEICLIGDYSIAEIKYDIYLRIFLLTLIFILTPGHHNKYGFCTLVQPF